MKELSQRLKVWSDQLGQRLAANRDEQETLEKILRRIDSLDSRQEHLSKAETMREVVEIAEILEAHYKKHG